METNLPPSNPITSITIMAPTLLINITPLNNKQKISIMVINKTIINNEIITKLMDFKLIIKR